MCGRVIHLSIKPGHKLPMQPVESCHAIEGKGLVGDASFGRPRRQVLLIEIETLKKFDLQPGVIRENIITRGVSLADLPKDTLIEIGEAVLQITGPCEPCDFLEDVRTGLRDALKGKRGSLARVQRSGWIRAGDPVRRVDVGGIRG